MSYKPYITIFYKAQCFGHQKSNVEVLRHKQEDTCLKSQNVLHITFA